MPKVDLILSAPVKDVVRLKQRLGKSANYVYLGNDFKKRRYLEAQLGNSYMRLEIAKLQVEVANDLRNEHIQWIDRLNARYGQDLEWWFGTFAARNIYTSNLFQYACYLEILDRLWTVSEQRPVLIFIESLGLLKAVQKWAADKGIRVEIFSNISQWRLVSQYPIALLKLGYFFSLVLMRIIAAYISKKEYKKKNLPLEDSVIVDTFVHDFSLDEQGNFHDNNLPNLCDYLAEQGLSVLIHPVLYGFRYNYFSIYRRLRRSPSNFIIPEDHLRMADYFQALKYPFQTLRRRIEIPRFRNFDLADIAHEDLVRTISDSSSLLAVLIFCLFKRLGDLKLRPRLIINWYENQVIDKALIAGARQAFPQTLIIGAQIFLYSLNLLYLFPTPEEVEAKVTPDIMLAMNHHLCDFAQTFTKAIPCYPAASLRYAYLFKGKPERSDTATGATLVILLPYDIREALAILARVKRVLDHLRQDCRFFIKCHPCYSPDRLKRSFGEKNWPERFAIFQGPIREALKVATVVISSNSGSMVEAAVWGIPVILLGSQTVLSQNVLEGVDSNLVSECFTENELVEALNRYLNASPQEIASYRQEGQNLLNLFFSPVNETTMRPFLGKIDKRPE